MLAAILTYINKAVAILLWPLSLLPAWLGLFLGSAVAGVILLFIYGKVSNQNKIKSVKKQIYTSLLESVLFRKDIRLCLAAQLKMFLAGGRYFSLAIFPVLILALPCILLLAEFNQLYAYRSFSLKESVIVKLQLESAAALEQIKLESVAGLEITPPVRIPASNEVYWRVDVKEAGNKDLVFKLGSEGAQFTHSLKVGEQQQRLSAVWDASWAGKLLYPAAPTAIPNVKSLSVSYAGQDYSLGFAKTNWLIFFLIFSMLAGIIASRYIGVEI